MTVQKGTSMKIISKEEGLKVLAGRDISQKENDNIAANALEKLLLDNPPARSPRPVVIGPGQGHGIGRLNVSDLTVEYNE